MTAFNTDYNTTELLDQELTADHLKLVAGGGEQIPPLDPLPGKMMNGPLGFPRWVLPPCSTPCWGRPWPEVNN